MSERERKKVRLDDAGVLTGSRKPKKHRSFVPIIALVLVIACGAAGILLTEKPKELEQTAQDVSSVQLIEVAGADIASIRIIKPDEDFTILCMDDSYSLADEPDFLLDTTRIRVLMAYCSSLKTRMLAAQAVTDMAPYGLDNPRAKVVVTLRSGEMLGIEVGEASPAGGMYIRRTDSDNVYIAAESICEALTAEKRSLHVVKALPALNTVALIRLSIQPGEQNRFGLRETITIERKPEGKAGVANYALTSPFVYDVDGEAYAALAERVLAIRPRSYLGKIDNAWNRMDGVRIEAEDNRGNSFKLMILPSGEDMAVCLDETDDAYRIDPSEIDFVRTLSVDALLERFACIVPLAQVSIVEVISDRASYWLDVEKMTINEKQLTETDFKTLYQQLIGVMVNSALDKDDQIGKTVVSVCYWITGGEQERVEYCELDKEYYAVQRNGSARTKVQKDKIEKMMGEVEKAAE